MGEVLQKFGGVTVTTEVWQVKLVFTKVWRGNCNYGSKEGRVKSEQRRAIREE